LQAREHRRRDRHDRPPARDPHHIGNVYAVDSGFDGGASEIVEKSGSDT
jgi:hypothetical protein